MAALPIFPLSVEQYHAIIDNGIVTPDDRVELHATRQALERLIPERWYVDEQKPITLETSEPEPDIAVIRGDTRDYFDRHPGPNEVALVVEIDGETKKRIYAAGGTRCYWIIDLKERRVEVYSNPKATSIFDVTFLSHTSGSRFCRVASRRVRCWSPICSRRDEKHHCRHRRSYRSR